MEPLVLRRDVEVAAEEPDAAADLVAEPGLPPRLARLGVERPEPAGVRADEHEPSVRLRRAPDPAASPVPAEVAPPDEVAGRLGHAVDVAVLASDVDAPGVKQRAAVRESGVLGLVSGGRPRARRSQIFDPSFVDTA